VNDFEQSMEVLNERFKRARRNQVGIAFVGGFLMWFFFGGADLLVSLIVAIVVAIGRWFFFTKYIA
jgi:hypothetical protein